MAAPHFYEVLQEVPEFAEEAKALIANPAFTAAVDNFLAHNVFSKGAALTPFYMANREILDILVRKHCPDVYNARTSTCMACKYNTAAVVGTPETCSLLLTVRTPVKNLNVYRSKSAATCPDNRWVE